MPARKPKIERIGNMILLKRDQWKDHTATISDYPGLLDEVMKYTWTYYESDHPYLKCGKLNTSLHKFVLAFLYGADQLNHMLNNDNIIEHLDNDGLNCAYDNLHIISADYNKAKAFTIDKERALEPDIPSFITDVYYSHEKHYYQMQVFSIEMYSITSRMDNQLKSCSSNTMIFEAFILTGCIFMGAANKVLLTFQPFICPGYMRKTDR